MAAVAPEKIIADILRLSPDKIANFGEKTEEPAVGAEVKLEGENKEAKPAEETKVEEAAVVITEGTEAQPVKVEEPAVVIPPVTAEITDEMLLAELNKRGRNITSLDDLNKPVVLTAEEMEAANAARKESAIKYALDKGVFTTKDLGDYNVDLSKPSREIAFALFTAEQKAGQADITPDAIEARFSEMFGEDLADDSWLKQQGQKRMDYMKDMYIHNRYGNITNAEQTYGDFETVEKAAKNYKTTVDTIFNSLENKTTFKFTDNDGKGKDVVKEFGYEFSPEDISEIKKNFLIPEHFEAIGKGELDTAKLKESVQLALKGYCMDKMIVSIARAYADDRVIAIEAERKGITPETAIGASINSDGKIEGLPVEAAQVVKNITGR